MRGLTAISLTCFTALASAYRVTSPGGGQGWTNVGPQPVTWERVATDRLNFTALLVNQGDPPVRQVLAAQVDGRLLMSRLNPPSGGWPTGDGFQLNFVRDEESLNTIFAQSARFSIKAPNGTSTSRVAPQNTQAASEPSASDDIASNPISTSAAHRELASSAKLMGLACTIAALLVI